VISFEQWLATAAREGTAAELRRIDELHAAVALYVNHGPLRDRERALIVTRFGGAIALRDRARPTEGRSNRVIAVEAADLRAIDDLVQFYEDVGIPCQLDLLASRWTAETAAVLRAKGFEYRGAACTSAGRPALRTPAAWTGVAVEPVTEDSLGEALAICAAVLGQPPVAPETARSRREELAEQTAYRLALARVDGEPAAIAAVFFHENAAYLAGAMTLPAMRRRGCQAALLEHRLQDAARSGCDLAATDTLGENESQRNVARGGLSPVCWPGWWVRPLTETRASSATASDVTR
jgi:GNAT superfamily N-acetyltransferase